MSSSTRRPEIRSYMQDSDGHPIEVGQTTGVLPSRGGWAFAEEQADGRLPVLVATDRSTG